MTHKLEIDIDKSCVRCKKKGATPSGLCLDCISKGISTGEFNLDKTQSIFKNIEEISRARKTKEKGGPMRIKKVKKTKEDKIFIVFEKRNKKQGYDEYSMSCSDPARPEFYDALEKLSAHVIDMCELPRDYQEKIIVKGVSYSYGGENDTMGATIISQLRLDKSPTDLNINTPHKIEEYYNDSDNGDPLSLLSGNCVEDLIDLQEECCKYVNGERAQESLFREAV